jgi:general stress protein CsbA
MWQFVTEAIILMDVHSIMFYGIMAVKMERNKKKEVG